MIRRAWFGAAVLAAACGGSPKATPGTQVKMDFTRGHFWDAPFPSDDLLSAVSGVDATRFDDRMMALVVAAKGMVAGAHGFASTGGVFLAFTDAIDPSGLPDLAGSVSAQSAVFLVEVAGPEAGRRYPLEVSFSPSGSPYGTANQLTLLPLQGVPLHPNSTYAAVVMRSLKDANGKPLGVPLAMAQLAQGVTPDGFGNGLASYTAAIAALKSAKVTLSSVAGMTVFTTEDSTAEFGKFRDDVLSRPPPAPLGPFMLTDTFPNYCVFQSTIGMPDYQGGNPPYSSSGGAWVVDTNGVPQLQRTETANIYLTIPRSTMPAAGYPLVVLSSTGLGGIRGLVDRGTQGMNGGPPLVPGSGPALYFALAGFAGVSIDGPLEGLRNTTGGNEDFLIFNVTNPPALRDNVRQSALELALAAHILASGTVKPDVSPCPGASGPVKFDATHFALMGHSMGATILPLAAAWEPMYRAIILSGAGGSWIENIVYKQQPVALAPLAELELDEPAGTLTAFDPVLSLVQWAVEAADPQVYDPRIVASAPHVLMEQGIVDHYILPRIANTTSLSLQLDLGGSPLDGNPAYVDQMQLTTALPLVGRSNISLPASGNQDGGVTAVVLQHPGNGIEDGHEVVFQTDPPKHQYRCFLQTWLSGTPTVFPDADAGALCQ